MNAAETGGGLLSACLKFSKNFNQNPHEKMGSFYYSREAKLLS
jgi:hypothetical protein